MLTADELWCQLYSEPGSGSDLASLRTTAERRGDTYIVNGQKVWTSQGMVADYAILLARTDPSVPKHKGITKFVINMRQPGVDVRPLRQITGHAEFCEVFMTNAEVPVEYRVGEDGQGWELAQTTLGYERGGSLLSRVARGRVQLQRLIDVCKTLPRNGGVAIDDSLVRQRLAKMLSELEILRYAGLRILSRLEKGQRPGPESSVDKLYYSEMDKRHQEWIQEILGPHALLWDGEEEAVAMEGRTQSGDDASWAYSYLWSRAGTIYSGSSEIQKNIIGERVLKLPREIRADRMATRS
jgi:alkylation response protein AidB-like acyl-CoA dehydrogenase